MLALSAVGPFAVWVGAGSLRRMLASACVSGDIKRSRNTFVFQAGLFHFCNSAGVESVTAEDTRAAHLALTAELRALRAGARNSKQSASEAAARKRRRLEREWVLKGDVLDKALAIFVLGDYATETIVVF